LRRDMQILDLEGSQIWATATGMLIVLLAFRTYAAFKRFWEGTTLLHQMRGEWFDTVSLCITFSISANRAEKAHRVKVFRHTLVRLMSLAHGCALEEISERQVKVIMVNVLGLDNETLKHLRDCEQKYQFNKVEIMVHLIQSLITNAFDDGILNVAPPILSRVYQTISRGFVNLLNAKKISDTRFPFPYAQLIAFLLLASTLLTPLMLSAVVTNSVMMFFLTFVPIFGMFSLNFIAIELENPFGIDDNDLPLMHFQNEMNKCLLMLLHPDADIVVKVSDECERDFNVLYDRVCGIAESYDERTDRLSQMALIAETKELEKRPSWESGVSHL